MSSKVFALVLLAASVSAQISSGCQSALVGITGDSAASSCLSPGSLVPLFVGNGSSSVVGPIDTWVTSICGAAPCSNETLSNVITRLAEGCSTELALTGYRSEDREGLITTAQQYYPTVRRALCLKDGNDNCVTKELRSLESVVGTLSITNIVGLVSGGFQSQIPSNVTCTSCGKEFYNVIQSEQPGLLNAEVKTSLQGECGADFVDGQTPTGISQSASTASAPSGTPSNAATGMVTMMPTSFFGAAGVSVLAVFAAAFTLLA